VADIRQSVADIRQSVADIVEFATAAAFFKLFIPSDATDQSADAVEKLMMTHEE
jgi:hypothetical protein